MPVHSIAQSVVYWVTTVRALWVKVTCLQGLCKLLVVTREAILYLPEKLRQLDNECQMAGAITDWSVLMCCTCRSITSVHAHLAERMMFPCCITYFMSIGSVLIMFHTIARTVTKLALTRVCLFIEQTRLCYS